MNEWGWAWKTAAVFLFVLAVTVGAGPAAPQADSRGQWAAMQKAWEARGFGQVEAAGRAFLATLPDRTFSQAIAALAFLSGAETVAGRIDEATAHMVEAFESLIQSSCRNQSFPYQMAGALLGQLLRDLPSRSRPDLGAMLIPVWEGLARKSVGTPRSGSLYKGVAAMLAGALASCYMMAGNPATARSFANEAWLGAPPAEIFPAEVWNLSMPSALCGCVAMMSRTEYLKPGDSKSEDDYREYVRKLTYACFHPPRASALLSALSVYIQLNDLDRIRRTTEALEDLKDRSLITGSLDGDADVRGQVEAACNMARTRYAQLWPSPGPIPAMSEAEAENDPRLGQTGPPFVRKKKSDVSFLVHHLILLKATLPAGVDRTATDGPWWLYRIEEGQLRLVGRAKTWKAAKDPKATWELQVERLALGRQWSTEGFFSENEAKPTLGPLGPVFVSRELLGPDFHGLPAHRLQLFREGLPWVGMSERLMRVNMCSCTTAMIQWQRWPSELGADQVLRCAGWQVKLSRGLIVGVSR